MEVKENNIYSFKLNSGEEIIAKVQEIVINSTEPDHYKVDAALGTGMTQKGMQLMPAMMSIELNALANIYLSSIAMISKPREDVADAYRESTTGIKVPDKQIILG